MKSKKRDFPLILLFLVLLAFLLLSLFLIRQQSSQKQIVKTEAKRPSEQLTVSALVNPPLFQAKKLAKLLEEKDGAISPLSKLLADKDAFAKIDPILLKAVSGTKIPDIKLRDKEGRIKYTVYLKEQLLSKKEDCLRFSQIKEKNTRMSTLVNELKTFSSKRQADIINFLSQKGEEVKFIPYWVFNGLSVSSDEETLLSLAKRPEVEKITPIKIISPPEPLPGKKQKRVKSEEPSISQDVEWNIAQVKADFVWALGAKGKGIVVGSIDSGVDVNHEILRRNYRGFNARTGQTDHNYNWFDASGGELAPEDNYGHGTHTVGTAVGEQGYGVAPEAKFIVARVFNPNGTTEDFHRAFQWMLAPCNLQGEDCLPELAPDVVINSWGRDGGDEEYWKDVLAWQAAGIFPEFSAGNSGSREGSLLSPADYPQSFATGAVDSSREIASFSSRGPSIYGEIKPEVVAPGVDVCSSVPTGYRCWNGTSMAGPHTAGAVALLKHLKPDLTVDELDELLKTTALDLGPPGPDNDFGWGELDLYLAASQIRASGFVFGKVLDKRNPAKTVANVVIKAKNEKEGEITIQSQDDGSYRLALSGGVWRITALESFWYFASTEETIIFEKGKENMEKNLSVERRPAGELEVSVEEEDTKLPLNQVLVKVSETPAQGETDKKGTITFSLPQGSYNLEVRPQAGHQVKFANTKIIIAEKQSLHFSLAKIKKILRVGQPQDRPRAKTREAYYQKAYDAIGWAYDFVPFPSLTLEQMLTYDVIHLSPHEKPLDFRGWNKLGEVKNYLNQGKALFLDSGLEAYYDSRGENKEAEQFLHEYLHANFVDDSSGQVGMLPLGIFAGQEAGTINDPKTNSEINHWWDIISPYDSLVETAAEYQRVGEEKTAGLYTFCPAELIFLSFDLASLGPLNARKSFIQQGINWLTTSLQDDYKVTILPLSQSGFVSQGTASYSTQIVNLGKKQDSYRISLDVPSGWNSTISPVETETISSCGKVPVEVNLTVPPSTPYGEKYTSTLMATSQTVVTSQATALLETISFPKWEEKQPMPNQVVSLEVVLVNNKIYALGGYRGYDYDISYAVNIYDPETDSWSFGAPIPEDPAYKPFGATAALGEEIYIIGRGGEGKTVLIYNTQTNSWRERLPLPIPIFSRDAVVFDNKIFLIARYWSDEENYWVDGIWIYDKDSGWVRKAYYRPVYESPLPHLRYVIHQEKIYGVGTKTAVYDIASDSWDFKKGPIEPREWGHGLAALGGYIYLAGGEHEYYDESNDILYDLYYDSAERYDIASDTWSKIPPLPSRTTAFNEGITYGNKIFIIGGMDEDRHIGGINYMLDLGQSLGP